MSADRTIAKSIAVQAVESWAAGDIEGARNRFRELDESITPGTPASTGSLMARLQGRTSGSWADVYYENERLIRKALHGSIARLTESLPSRRFEVLGTKHAPRDPERYRPEVMEGLRDLASRYGDVALMTEGVWQSHSLPEAWQSPHTAVLEDGVRAFLQSLGESAERVSRDLEGLVESGLSDASLAAVARLHDSLAQSLEHYTLGLAYAEHIYNLPSGDDR